MKFVNFVLVGFQKAFPADLNEGTFQSTPREEVSIQQMTGKDAPIENILTEPKEYSSSDSDRPDRIHFYLYTQANISEPVEIDINDMQTLVRSPYDFRNPTTIMIHGWKDNYSYGASSSIRNSMFQKGRKLNFISIDWRVYSDFKNYTLSQQECSTTGKVLAHFIDWMFDNARMSFETLSLYGSSMGAQVAGFAGKNVQRGKIHSIIAMDPALPLFEHSNPKGRLADTDAEYVESIHTNGGHWGFYEPIGQTAFYPNGGKKQPGCGSDLDGMCSHQRAVDFLAEALSSPEENEFHAVKCDKLEHVEERNCDQYESVIRLGDPNNAQRPRGIYYLETNSESPYARGVADNSYKKSKK